jgi:hypothetical protein
MTKELIDDKTSAEYIIYRLQDRLRMTNDTLSKYGKSHRKLINKNYEAAEMAAAWMEKQPK